MRPKKRVLDLATGRVFAGLVDYAKFYGIQQSQATRALQLGMIEQTDLEVDTIQDDLCDGDFSKPMCVVTCLTHNKSFESIADAEKYYKYNRGTLFDRIMQRNWKIDGLVWEYKDMGVCMDNRTYIVACEDRQKIEKIQCVETGEIFNSIRDVCKFTNRHYTSIYRSMKFGIKCGGYSFVSVG